MHYHQEFKKVQQLYNEGKYEDLKEAAAKAIDILLNWPPDEEKSRHIIAFYNYRGIANCALGLKNNNIVVYRYGQNDFLKAIENPQFHDEPYYAVAYGNLKSTFSVVADFEKHVEEFRNTLNE